MGVVPQTLTRVSISRNSQREMIQIFPSRSREANFHVSFSSRFSRLENNFSFFFRPISLSPLDFQDFWRKFLCLLSIFKIFLINILIIEHDMSKYASITLSFDHFHFHPTAQLVPDLILTLCQTKIAERESFYHSDFLSSRKFNIFVNFYFSSRNWGKEFQISLSPLECGEIVFKFLIFSSRFGLFCISSMT